MWNSIFLQLQQLAFYTCINGVLTTKCFIFFLLLFITLILNVEGVQALLLLWHSILKICFLLLQSKPSNSNMLYVRRTYHVTRWPFSSRFLSSELKAYVYCIHVYAFMRCSLFNVRQTTEDSSFPSLAMVPKRRRKRAFVRGRSILGGGKGGWQREMARKDG